MAQGDSIVGICNAAMIELGEDPIASLNDPTKRAILCNAKYDQVRRELLGEFPWGCAKAYAQLAASPTAPLFKWGNAFPKPADFVRMWDVDGGLHTNDPNWEIVGPMIYTDEDAPLNLQYVFDQQDPTRFDALFAKCLGLKLAEAVCIALTQSEQKLQAIRTKLMDAMPAAQTVDSQSDGPQAMDEDVWLRSRG